MNTVRQSYGRFSVDGAGSREAHPWMPSRDNAVYYGASALDVEEVRSSTSGGLASVFSRVVLREGGIVCAAAYEPFPRVRHRIVFTENELHYVKGSKYVYGEVAQGIRQVKSYIDKGMAVLFIGLPCQVAALYASIGGDRPNLFTIDLICHGTPPPRLFEHWIAELEKKSGEKIVSYRFRTKSDCAWNDVRTHLHEYTTASGRKIRVSARENWYGRYFLGSSSFRNCCYKCRYAHIPRIGDVTLGDFWGCEKDSRFKTFVENGVSLVSVQSAKGFDIVARSQNLAKFIQVDREFAIRANHQLSRCSKRPIYRIFLFQFVYLHPILRNVCDKVLFGVGKLVSNIARKLGLK